MLADSEILDYVDVESFIGTIIKIDFNKRSYFIQIVTIIRLCMKDMPIKIIIGILTIKII